MSNSFDISKVSRAFRAKVEDAMAEGKKGVADKKEDFEALQKLLSGTQDTDEQGYVRSKMDEYTTKYKVQDLKDRASGFVRETVDGMKKIFAPKNALDVDEAKKLLPDLESAEKDGRTADAEYIRAELEAAGFGKLLEEYDGKKAAAKVETDAKNKEDKKKVEVKEAPKPSITPEKEPLKPDNENAPKPVYKKPSTKPSTEPSTKPSVPVDKKTKPETTMKLNPEQQKVAKDIKESINEILELSKTHSSADLKMRKAIRKAKAVLDNANALKMEKTVIYNELRALVEKYDPWYGISRNN